MKRSGLSFFMRLTLVVGVASSLLASAGIAFAGALNGPLIQFVNYDRAAYSPGAKVSVYVTLKNNTGSPFTGSIDLTMSSRGDVIGSPQSQTVSSLAAGASTTLTFVVQPPSIDYRGYLLSLCAVDQNHTQIDSAGGAVDVSSDWSKFPRYGYVTEFTAGTNALAIVQALNTYHINGLQFYDVNYQHHRPYSPNSQWPNLSNTMIDRSVVLNLINTAHQYGMKAMNYNLWNGAYADYQTDGSGAQLAWGQFTSACAASCTPANQAETTGWPQSWATPALLEMNPADPGWQNLLFNGTQGEAQLFNNLPYDGWHIDTLGDPAIQYDINGNSFWTGNDLASFANNAKTAIGNRSVLLNNLSRWNQASVASSANVDFLYTELWSESQNYLDLNAAAKQARSSVSKPIVFPAYMNTTYASNNYGCTSCTFDEASIRLVDDAMLAASGIHLEMGDIDKMISNIYWPGPMLQMSPSLQEADLDIANFAVAYENLLRYGVTDAPNAVSLTGAPSSTNASAGAVWMLPKAKAGFQILNLINLAGNTSTIWRDENATYVAPPQYTSLPVKFYYTGTIDPHTSRLMVATPDYNHGQSMRLNYTAGSDSLGTYVQFFLPHLFYWDLIYLETSQLSGQDYNINPFTQVEAETYNNSSMGGIGVLDSTDYNLGELVGNACCNRWVEYENVDFAGGSGSVQVRVATAVGGNMEFHLDSPTGPLIASGIVPNTGGWQTWTTTSFPVSGASGVHNLYMVFPGAPAVNVNFFRFS